MSTIKKWRIYCQSDNKWEYRWDSVELTVCPVNSGHTVNIDSSSELETIIMPVFKTVTSADSPYRMDAGVLECDTTSGNIVVDLRHTRRSIGHTFFVKKTDVANTVTIQGKKASHTIDGNTTYVLNNLGETVVISTQNGTTWVTNTIANEVNMVKESFEEFIVVSDERVEGTHGGTATKGAWNTRVLNTLKSNGNNSASLAANQLTLQPGDYVIQINAPAYQCGRHQLRLYDTTNSIVIDHGVTAMAANKNNRSTSISMLETLISIDDQTTFEIQHRVEYTKKDTGYGIASGFSGSTEVYAKVMIRKLV